MSSENDLWNTTLPEQSRFFFPLPNQIRIWIQVAATKMFVTICICYTSLFRSVQVLIAVSSLVLIVLFEKLFQAGACVSSRGWTSGTDRFAEKLYISDIVVLQEPVLCCRLLGHPPSPPLNSLYDRGKTSQGAGLPWKCGMVTALRCHCLCSVWVSISALHPPLPPQEDWTDPGCWRRRQSSVSSFHLPYPALLWLHLGLLWYFFYLWADLF